jgi:uncharacterized protein (TIGR02996 family)
MHPDEVALLEAVCECPDDDAPRLIYADWLEESGLVACVARAEFIRVQVRLEQIADIDPAKKGLQHRAWQLLHEHSPIWLAPMGMSLWGVSYRRGFLDRATTRSDLVLQNPEWFARQPIANLEVELDQGCWNLVIGMLAQRLRPESNDDLVSAWDRACTTEPRLTLMQSGGEAEALAWHPLIHRVRELRLSVAWNTFRREGGPLSAMLNPRVGP